MSNQTVVTDPYDAADNPVVRQAEYWGQVQTDMFFAVLVKGVGKVPFDPAQHAVDKRVTAIEIKIIPVAEQNVTYDVSRSLIAESREWAGIVLPSIKALGISVRELNGKWVHVQQKATGQTYINGSGETKDRTTFEFVQLYANELEAAQAYQASNGQPAPVHTEPPSQQTPTNGNNKERETALKFLGVIVENAARGQTDLGVINQTVALNLANMPLVNKYFTIDSPETMTLVMEKMNK